MSEKKSLADIRALQNPASLGDTSAETCDHASSVRSHLTYSLLLVLLPLLAIPLFISLGRTDFFLHHGASVWVRSNDAVYSMADRDCDILVFGDSTAMTGINPEVVERNTGYKTCNIAVTNAVLAVTDTLTLDHYLAHNPRPRVLLIQLSPDGFQSENHVWGSTIYPEGVLELLRHGTPQQSRSLLIGHPREAIAFAGYTAGFTAFYGIKSLWFRATSLHSPEDDVVVRNGFFTPPAPPRTSCDAASPVNDATQGAFSRALVDGYHVDYAGRAGLVLVNVAPIPSCDLNLATYRTELNGITSNSLLPLPIGFFNDGRHYTAIGSTVVSRLISEEVNQMTGNSIVTHTGDSATQSIAALRRISLNR